MKSRHVHRISTLCRQSFLVLLMLCLVVQPVIAGRGALHEAIDHSGSSVTHADLHATQWQTDSTETDGDGDGDGDAGASHQLMHHAHCCAQPQLPLSGQLQLPAFKPVARVLWAPTNAITADAHAATPFRPPIQA